MSQPSPARFIAYLPHWLGGAIAVSTVMGFNTAPAAAQIMPDNTLGSENSVVTPGAVPGGPGILIEGGAARGGNLFHSFNEFNVNNGQRVYFADPAAIENILTRVTGENGSFIDGVLGVNGLANLYFLNPNGVIFGPNARLDVRGSFVTSAGNSFRFADGSEFSALPTARESLTVSVPLGVQFNDQAQGEIKQRGALEVGAGESLTLFGETVTVQGELTAPGGTVEVLGDVVTMGDTAAVNVSSATGGGTVLIGGDYKGGGTVPNAQQTRVEPEATIEANALESGDGGRVIVWADGTTQFGGSIEAKGGPQGGDGGFIETSGQIITVKGGTGDASAPLGKAGTWLVDPTNITIGNGGGNTIQVNTIETTLAGGTNFTATTDTGGTDPGTIVLNDPINATATNNATLELTASSSISGPADSVNIANGNLILNVNQAGVAETKYTTGIVSNAVNVVGNVTGTNSSTINIGPGTYQEGAEIVIDKNLTLTGQGKNTTILDGANAHRVLNIGAGVTANLNTLAVNNGELDTVGGEAGAGIFNAGTLTVDNTKVSNNRAIGFLDATGGIDNEGTLIIKSSEISNNFGENGAGGIFNSDNSNVKISNSTISGNQENFQGGGGINNNGTLEINDSVISDNLTSSNGVGNGGGGIINRGDFTIVNTIIQNNKAQINGGGIYHIGDVFTKVTSRIENSTINNNKAINGSGGGIYTPDFAASTTLFVENSTINSNSAGDVGGGIANFSITALSPNGGEISITDSTVSDNNAGYSGGGIWNQDRATMSVLRSTIANNTSALGDAGGISNGGQTKAAISVDGGILSIASSLLTNNTGGGTGNSGGATNFYHEVDGTLTNQGNNLFGANSLSGVVIEGFPFLEVSDIVPTVAVSQILNTALADYGGSTQTLGLVPGSPAIDVGSGTDPDQRGVAVVNGVRDIGAFESQGYELTLVSGNQQIATLNEAFSEPLVVNVSSAFGEPIAGGRVFFTAPTTGASATLSSNEVILDASGRASVTAISNGFAGAYSVVAEVNPTVEFDLVNLFSLPDPSAFIISRATGGELEIPVDDSDILFNLGQDPVGVTGPLSLTLSESDLIALQSACSPGGGEGSGALIFSGSGGLPPGPNNPQVDDAIDIPWVEPDGGPAAPVAPTEADQSDGLIDSQVMVVDGDGAVYFVASATPQALQSFGVTGAELCQALSSP